LRDLPKIGHVGQAEGTREIVVRGLPYVIVYEINTGDQDEVMI
jgi:plasmid stabilization system protein ParE